MTTDELVLKMAVVLLIRGQWSARAAGSSVFHTAGTPREAMLLALGVSEPPEPNSDLF